MPERLLDIAKELQDSSDTSQARLRSIVNRSYYSAYLTARQYCESHKLGHGFGSAHEKVIDTLRQHPESMSQGNQLHDMKRLRHQADYKWQRPLTYRDAKKAYGTCCQLVAFFTS